jgi:hypothetical protein
MATTIPQQIFEKATACGLKCISSETGEHQVHPDDDQVTWYLVCRKGTWILMVNDTPQMNMRYEEVLKFLDRFA